MTEAQKDKLAWFQERATVEEVHEADDGSLNVFLKESKGITVILPNGSHYGWF